VVGVNTAIFSPSGGSVGIAFASPAATVETVVAQLKEHGSVTRGWIGVQIQPVTSDIADSLGLKDAKGALVSQPQDGSPASKAGIEAGDVITAVNDEQVKDARDLAKKIGAMVPNAEVKLAVLRDGKQKTVSLQLGEMPATQKQARNENSDGGAADIGKLGLTLAPADRVGANDTGVVVTGVDPSGVAAGHGFSTGDVILEVSGKRVSSPADVRKELAGARNEKKRAVLMRVKSGDNTKFVALPIGRG
jgi:serine protease Do